MIHPHFPNFRPYHISYFGKSQGKRFGIYLDFNFRGVYKRIMEKLTKMEKKNLLEKISPFVADQILPLYKPAKAKYTLAEIYTKCGLTPNRTSDIATKRKPVYETALRLLVKGGIVNIKELLKKKGLTQQERDYLEAYLVYEDDRLQEALRQARIAGKDPAQMIFDGLRK